MLLLLVSQMKSEIYVKNDLVSDVFCKVILKDPDLFWIESGFQTFGVIFELFKIFEIFYILKSFQNLIDSIF